MKLQSSATPGLAAQLTTLTVAGWVFGALGFGVPLSLLHVVHSRLASSWDALVTLAWFLVLYGGIGALVFVPAGVGCMALGGRAGSRPQGTRAVGAGIVAATTLFWARYLHMGLTYGEVPFPSLHSPAGLLFYVAVRLVLVVLAATVLARMLAGALASPLVRRPRAWLATIAIVATAHLLVPLTVRPGGAAGPLPTAPPRSDERGLSVVFVGIDGADWSVIRSLIAEGALPAFAHLIERGSSGSLATIVDANSAEIWASIYTGKPSAVHGIEDFVHVALPGMRGPGLFAVYGTYFKNLGGYLARVGLARQSTVDRRHLHAMPVWEMAMVGGLSVGVVNGFYYTYPPPIVPASESYIVAYGAARATAHRHARSDVSNAEILANHVQPPELVSELGTALEETDVAWQRSAMRVLLRGSRPRFFHVYTREPDQTQHRYWKWYQPQYFLGVSADDMNRFGDEIPQVYRRIDALLADLLPLIGPETVLIVASDHGHSPTMLHPKIYSHHQHGPPGVLLMAGGPIEPGASIEGAHVYDLAPTILYLLGLPVPDDAAGRVLRAAIAPAALAGRRVRRIESYEPWQGELRYASGGDPTGAADEIGRLRALGYVE